MLISKCLTHRSVYWASGPGSAESIRGCAYLEVIMTQDSLPVALSASNFSPVDWLHPHSDCSVCFSEHKRLNLIDYVFHTALHMHKAFFGSTAKSISTSPPPFFSLPNFSCLCLCPVHCLFHRTVCPPSTWQLRGITWTASGSYCSTTLRLMISHWTIWPLFM